MDRGSWHSETLRRISHATAADPDVRETWVLGSGAEDTLDEWSDLDVAVVVPADEVLRLASPSWLAAFGPVWTYQSFQRDHGCGVRVVYRDGRHVDLMAVTERAAIPSTRRRCDLDLTGTSSAPPDPGSARRAAESVLAQPSLVHEFRFTAALSVRKSARDDLLIGGHLALDLPRLCLVVAMSLRDRDEGTSHHRYGGPWNSVLDRVLDLVPDAESGRGGLLDLVDASAGLFDDLAGQLWPSYAPDWSGLTALLDRVRASS